MTDFRFIHSSDLHLGRRFGNFPEEIRGRLVEARHTAIDALASAAREHQAQHVLIAGDLFDTETPSERIWRQALAAMHVAEGLVWWILPGNHDSLAAETLWRRFREEAPASVHLLAAAEPVDIASRVTIVPSPVTSRFPGRDLTEWMPECPTPDGHLRIGLAHGGVVTFGSEDGGRETIAIDRAQSAALDYLALGDWHGYVRISERTFYSGSPERDRFKHQGRGVCLAVTVPGAGAEPKVSEVATGKFDWSELTLHLTPEQDAARELTTALPAAEGVERRDALVQILATGWVGLPQRMSLKDAVEHAAPEFCHLEFIDGELTTECAAEDLDEIASSGALRIAAEALYEGTQQKGASREDWRVAEAALRRLYSFVRGLP